MSTRIDVAAWHERLRGLEQRAVAQTEEVLGLERDVFLDAMANIFAILQAVMSTDSIEEVDVKAKLAIAHRGFDLLWSSWNETLWARYGASADHWRTIDETPEYLKALQVAPDLAREWFARKLTIETVQRTITRGYADLNASDRGKRRHQEFLEVARLMQPLSHVSVESTAAVLPVEYGEDGAPVAIKIGGEVSGRIARPFTVFLAHAAVQLLAACAFAFQGRRGVLESWELTGNACAERGVEALLRIAGELGLLGKAEPIHE